MNWLLPAIGKKIPLVRLLRHNLWPWGRVIATDLSAQAPAGKFAHRLITVPRLSDPTFIPTLEKIITDHKIKIILPTRQQEFIFWSTYAQGRHELAVLLSGRPTLDICLDKMASHRWLASLGLPTPTSFLKKDLPTLADAQKLLGALPYFAKPADGSASVGAAKITTAEEFNALPPEMLVQQVLTGDEYTLNAYVDKSGRCRVVIPHRRIEVTDGEVSLGITVKNDRLIELGRTIAEKLPGAYGPLNFQVFWNHTTDIMGITDLNPRLGGGYPLAHAAGGEFVRWLQMEAEGKKLPESIKLDRWKAGLTLHRVNGQVFIVRGS